MKILVPILNLVFFASTLLFVFLMLLLFLGAEDQVDTFIVRMETMCPILRKL